MSESIFTHILVILYHIVTPDKIDFHKGMRLSSYCISDKLH